MNKKLEEQIERVIGDNDPAFKLNDNYLDKANNELDKLENSGSSINIKKAMIATIISLIGIAIYEVLTKG